ncbi:hypothetical protein Tdes44962_MAKER07543 [Teratosphaeria destructans]|uniref:Uncharacterized protein n=1 Tax=Teratosphaeria destructans TaxID=418781 RepID=A0A9W7SZ04_9PEZI|nr:hypothetical protein Tdes44962_MAKER07543 [Teratosphaeria destructans]
MGVHDLASRLPKQLPQWLQPSHHAEQTTLSSPHDPSQSYLLGLRGCLTLMTFLWVFLQTFAPAAVAHSANTTGPASQLALRKSLSILFWNDSLIYSSIIFLSARTICLPFLLDPGKTTLASAVLRRGLRLWFPVAATLVVVYAVFSRTLGTAYLKDFATETSNASMVTGLYELPSSLANFNSIFQVFWISHDFSYQAASFAFPTQTLWIISALFQQSYTVYTTMVIIPYTRQSWRITGAAVFILTAWWVYSWAWFSISGLLLADLVVNMDFRGWCRKHRLGTLGVAGGCLVVGYAMQWLWVTAYPDLYDAEIFYHTGTYNTGGRYTWNDTTAPLLRADDYLVIIGFSILLESFEILRKIFSNPALVFLGKRSYSYFCLQSIIIYTLGIKSVMNMMGDSLDGYSRATGVAFISCLLVTAAAGEAFYWFIDLPSQKFARVVFAWIRE